MQQQHGPSTASALNRRILDTLPKLTWSASHESEATAATECATFLSDYEEVDEQLQHGQSVAFSRRILDTLPRLTWSVGHQSSSVECAIYLSEYQESDELRVLLCQHVLTPGLL
nr:hypothetical protein [Tanacetum cinerariifolium]